MSQSALRLWEDKLDQETSLQITVGLEDLPDGQLGEAVISAFGADGRPADGTIVLDIDANGLGWFIDETPLENGEFATQLTTTAFRAETDSAAGRYDLLTVILHEMGHLFGFVAGWDGFDQSVQTVGGSQLFVSPNVTAVLTDDQSHLDSMTYPYDLMNDTLRLSERKLPSLIDTFLINTRRGAVCHRGWGVQKMTATAQTLQDVFLTPGPHDKGLAEVIKREFAEADLEVYGVHDVEPCDALLSEMRRALAECSAFAVILTRATLHSQDFPFQIGMPMAWNKPMYVIYEGIAKTEIPEFLQSYPMRQVGDIDRIVREISESQQPFSNEDRDSLIQTYRELGVPTDQLLLKPLALHELAEKYNSIGPANFAAERLVQELIRLRKQGKLTTKMKKA